MRISAFVQGFGYGRGRATTALELLAPLASAGHDVDVYVTATAPASHEEAGCLVQRLSMWEPRRRPDVVIFNSGMGERVLDIVKKIRAPKLMCQHSYDYTDAGLSLARKVWFPSRASLRADRGQGRYSRFVVPPPINPDLYKVTPGKRIGLSLSSPWKGGLVVARMAKMLPMHEFLVIKDPRGNGVGAFKGLRNVEMASFMEPRDFYAQTRVQLFPSRSESYGRVAVEGAISGIPLVASRCPGIREAMSGHGIYIDRNKPRQWAHITDRLMTDPAYWRRASRDVSQRGRDVGYRKAQRDFVREVESMA